MQNTNPDEYVARGSVARLRQSLGMNEDTPASRRIKDSTRDIVTQGISDFQSRMATGQVKVDNISDLERLVKLGLLVEGSATEITQDNSTDAVIEISDEQYRALSEGEDFEALQARLMDQLNHQNQTALEDK